MVMLRLSRSLIHSKLRCGIFVHVSATDLKLSIIEAVDIIEIGPTTGDFCTSHLDIYFSVI